MVPELHDPFNCFHNLETVWVTFFQVADGSSVSAENKLNFSPVFGRKLQKSLVNFLADRLKIRLLRLVTSDKRQRIPVTRKISEPFVI